LREEWNEKYARDLEEKKSQLQRIQGERTSNLDSLKNLAELVSVNKIIKSIF
jgi:hypothetical protein